MPLWVKNIKTEMPTYVLWHKDTHTDAIDDQQSQMIQTE